MTDQPIHASNAALSEPAEIVREYGPFPVKSVNGVSYDGKHIWFAAGDKLHAIDAETGAEMRAIDVACNAGTAYDGTHLYQLSDHRIYKIDPQRGEVLSSFAVPREAHDVGHDAGLTWAEGSLWMARHHSGKILQLDPDNGQVRRTLECDHFVTGVTFAQGELWHGTWQDGQPSELRQIDPRDGRVLIRLTMPPDTIVAGLESNGADLLFCGGGRSGRVRVVRKPKRKR